MSKNAEAAQEIGEEYERVWEVTIGAVSKAQVASIAKAVIDAAYPEADNGQS